ncbi:hypothetical protein HHK36_009749 [Tetracentron sinense]|uniref:Uncharacterized protein n=1 Tax=Tetracentron sinense TaxID=13715 RepID=A0A834ZBG3_TETSI|nr:hypothetical protein HHK36_009749 [Tetracentron sinense]
MEDSESTSVLQPKSISAMKELLAQIEHIRALVLLCPNISNHVPTILLSSTHSFKSEWTLFQKSHSRFCWLAAACRQALVAPTTRGQLLWLAHGFGSAATINVDASSAPRSLPNQTLGRGAIEMKMDREEKRRKFHEALLSMLYPPPQQQEVEDEPVDTGLDLGLIPGDDELEEGNSSTSVDEDESAPQKLSRAQRKRLRKKKLKETASRRRKLIGPQLPSTDADSNDEEPPNLRDNAVEEESDAGIHNPEFVSPGEQLACTAQNKLKRRRMAKRLGQSTVNCSSFPNTDS